MISILIVNTPKNCYECPCSNEGCYLCQISRRQLEDDFQDRRPSWCPLKSLPQKIEGKREKFMPTYSLGWNDCLDAVELGLTPLWEKKNESNTCD